MPFKEMLEALKAGTTPTVEWKFENAVLDCAKRSVNHIDCLITPSVVLGVGENKVGVCRTFCGHVSINENTLTTITFDLIEYCPWHSLDSGEDCLNPPEFEELMEYLQDQYSELLIPVHANVSESDRKSYQKEIDDMVQKVI